MKKLILLTIVLTGFFSSLSAQQKITISDPKNQVIVTANLYLVSDTLPYIILCHQAGFSRGEFKESAIRFCKLGFNCIAVDLRSGGEVNEVKNETAAIAKNMNLPCTYLDAEQDIISAINYAFAKNNRKVILFGSSYSASLALKIAVTNDKVKAVIAFSPGEYFGDKLNLKKSITKLDKPAFVTSSKAEAADVTALLKDLQTKKITQFIPAFGDGVHGSSALWKDNKNEGEYWAALMMFLKSVK